MEENIKSDIKLENGLRNDIVKPIYSIRWPDNLAVINLSSSNIKNLDENVKFPPNLKELNISHNCLVEIPSAILNLDTILLLDLSFNEIVYFDETPGFCHSIKSLNLSNNQLEGPPYWVWSKAPRNLEKLDISGNTKITRSINEYYLQELLEYKTNLKEVNIASCRLERHLELLKTFCKANILEVGALSLNINKNILKSVPCSGLSECCDVNNLNLMNTSLYVIEPSVNIYKNMTELDLSFNSISNIPNEFCELVKLEVCILSDNNLLYLPDDMVKLVNLMCLRLDSNDLCMYPDSLNRLPNLKVLDLYNNRMYEMSDKIDHIEELDLAMNYMDEPESERYCEQKLRLRLNYTNRFDGRKAEDICEDSEHSSSTTDDEELIEYLNNLNTKDSDEDNIKSVSRAQSSPEDWDSDECWVPSYRQNITPDPSQWLSFVHKKMCEGNFCPMDQHPVSVVEQVKYEKMNNPREWKVYSGQYDDYSEDDS